MIQLTQLLTPERIVDLAATTKRATLDELCELLVGHPHVLDGERLRSAMLEREALVSTGIGLGIAVPHVKIPEVRDYVIAVGRQRAGIDFDALDDQPVQLVFMIAASERQVTDFVKVLARVVRLLKNPDNRSALLEAALPDEFLEIVRRDDDAQR